jgi:hypothetical protein
VTGRQKEAFRNEKARGVAPGPTHVPSVYICCRELPRSLELILSRGGALCHYCCNYPRYRHGSWPPGTCRVLVSVSAPREPRLGALRGYALAARQSPRRKCDGNTAVVCTGAAAVMSCRTSLQTFRSLGAENGAASVSSHCRFGVRSNELLKTLQDYAELPIAVTSMRACSARSTNATV